MSSKRQHSQRRIVSAVAREDASEAASETTGQSLGRIAIHKTYDLSLPVGKVVHKVGRR